MDQPSSSPSSSPSDSPDRYRASRDLFERASTLDSKARRAVLDAARAADAELVAEVESMLKFFDQTSAALDHAPGDLIGGELGARPTPLPEEEERRTGTLPGGTVVDQWIIDRVLAVGGVGVIYAATSTVDSETGELARPMAAIKLIRAELVTPAMLARFDEHGSRVTALAHPGLARIFRAASIDIHETPRPFIAQELVIAPPITEAVTTLDRRARLGLLVSLCDAVAAAHVHGVTDGELTPDRIRVNLSAPSGTEIRVLGFGIDRLLIHEPAATPRRLTTIGSQSVYEAPELSRPALGQPDTQVDIYSLGAIMYEVLAGKRPRPPIVNPGIDAGLDPIVSCAMSNDPARRYQSPAEMAADIRAWLTRTPPARPQRTVMSQRRRFWMILLLALIGTFTGAMIKYLLAH